MSRLWQKLNFDPGGRRVHFYSERPHIHFPIAYSLHKTGHDCIGAALKWRSQKLPYQTPNVSKYCRSGNFRMMNYRVENFSKNDPLYNHININSVHAFFVAAIDYKNIFTMKISDLHFHYAQHACTLCHNMSIIIL